VIEAVSLKDVGISVSDRGPDRMAGLVEVPWNWYDGGINEKEVRFPDVL
jgi:hypothetical protein